MTLYYLWSWNGERWELAFPVRNPEHLFTNKDYHRFQMRPIVITSSKVNGKHVLEYCRDCSPDMLHWLLG